MCQALAWTPNCSYDHQIGLIVYMLNYLRHAVDRNPLAPVTQNHVKRGFDPDLGGRRSSLEEVV